MIGTGTNPFSATSKTIPSESGKNCSDTGGPSDPIANGIVDSAQTYVLHREDCVAGYYSLTVGSVDRVDCAPSITADMPPDYPIPVVVLARLAVDRKDKGRGLGRTLLKDALLRIASAAEIVGARAVLVHAIEADAKTFYEHFEFEEFPAGTLQLMLSMKELRASMSAS